MNKKKTLQTYLDITLMIKNSVTTQLLTAKGEGKIDISTDELKRIISLTETAIQNSSANGYEALQRIK